MSRFAPSPTHRPARSSQKIAQATSVDIVLSVLNVIFGSFWALIMVVAAVCGLIGAQVFNGCLVVT